MTDAKPLVAPVVCEPENTLLFLSQRLASVTQGGFEIDVFISTTFIEAEVRATHSIEPSKFVLTERITIEPTLQAWLADLLERAKEKTS